MLEHKWLSGWGAVGWGGVVFMRRIHIGVGPHVTTCGVAALSSVSMSLYCANVAVITTAERTS